MSLMEFGSMKSNNTHGMAAVHGYCVTYQGSKCIIISAMRLGVDQGWTTLYYHIV